VLRRLVLLLLLSYKVLPKNQVAALADPSTGGATVAIAGPRGRILVSIDLPISILGSYLSSMQELICDDTCLASGCCPTAAIN
jgi:arginine:ornithine antiporter / lysine permease